MSLQLNSLVCLAAAGLLIFGAGCESHRGQAVLQPVGPAPEGSSNPGSQGYLVVYSAWSNFVDQGSMGHHSRYRVASENGNLTREVINHVDRFDEGPIRLPLPPGVYQVSARSAHFGRVKVPVIIKTQETTFVYLDGASHSDAPSTEQNNAVRLPNGEIIGWSGTVANNTH